MRVQRFLLCACVVTVGVLSVWALEVPDGPDEVEHPQVHLAQVPAKPQLPRLGGQVENEAGWLLGDVVVTLTPIGGDPRAEVTAFTDSSGWWSSEVAPGRYRLGVFALDYLPQITEIELPSAEEIVTRLRRGGTVTRGKVHDYSNRAIAGARVVFHDRDRVAAVAFTARDGSFAATLAGSYTRVAAHAEGHVDNEQDYETGDIELRLMPGVSVQGVVALGDGEPCRDADVRIEVELDSMYRSITEVRTDPDGRFSAVAASGSAEVTAAGPGCSVAIPLRAQLEGPREVKLVADPGYQISGRVVARGSKAPVHDATVTLDHARSRAIKATTDADGRFVFEGVPASSISLSVEHAEHTNLANQLLEVDADHEVTLELAGGRRIRGRVEPPVAARLDLELHDWENVDPTAMRPRVLDGTSEADGSFTLTGVPDGDYTLVAHTADGRSGTVTVKITADREGVRIPLVADGNATLSGRVVDDRGAPVADQIVAAVQAPYTRDRHITTDADGRFRFERLPAVSTGIYLEQRERIGDAMIELVSGATATITVVVQRKDAVIRGRVVGDSRPVPNVWVMCAPAEPTGAFYPSRVLTREDGSFELVNLQRHAHTLTVESPQGWVGSTRAEPDSTVTIPVTRRHELMIAATRDGKPVRDYHLACTSERGGGFSTGVRSADGSYRAHLRVVGPVACFGEIDGTGAVVETDGHGVELVFERLAVATGRVPIGSRVVYRHGAQPQGNPDEDLFRSRLAQVDEAGNFKLDVFHGPGTITIRDEAFRVLLTYPVTGTPGGRIDLGTMTID